MSEEIVSVRGGKKELKISFVGPASYTTGGAVHTVAKLGKLDAVYGLHSTSGYFAQVVQGAISGSAFKYKVFWQDGVSGNPLKEVASGTVLTGVTFEGVAVGK